MPGPLANEAFPTASRAIKALNDCFRRQCSARWTYCDAIGELVGCVLRYDLPDGKQIRPIARNPDGTWRIGAMPEPQPLYNLLELPKADPSAPVIVAEGEKNPSALDCSDPAEVARRIVEAAEPWKPTVSVNSVSTATPTVRLADVEAEAVDWLWPNRIPLGCVTLICGRPGVGKSFLTCDLAARVSAGLPLPDGAQALVGDTLLLAAEDDPARKVAGVSLLPCWMGLAPAPDKGSLRRDV